jgi:SAM-dependent methyltransferase
MPETPHTDGGGRHPWSAPLLLSDLTRQDIWSCRRRFLQRLWSEARGLRVVEVGSGPAHDSLVFAEMGAEVTAVDRSEEALAMGRRFYGELGLPLRTVLADIRHLELPDAGFDLAFNAGVLEHFDDEYLRQVLAEMIRVVRPGGCVLAFCPNRYNFYYQRHLSRLARHDYDFERAFTAVQMQEFFCAGGLRDVHLSGVHVHPAPNYLLPAWLPKHHRIEPWCRWCFSWLENLNGCHKLKSLIGQDFVVWGTAGDGPAVLSQQRLRRPA